MVDPNSRLAGFLQPVRGYATGDEVIRPKITVEFGEHEEPTSTTNVGMLKTMEPMQSWIEENIGEDKEVLGSRTLHTLGKEKLFTAPSSGFGQEYAAENIPVLKDMDPLSRGIYNTLAPYGEKLFDVLDTFIRLPGAGAADIAQAAGVEEKDVNEIQSLINTGVALAVPTARMQPGAATQVINNISKAGKVIKTEAKWLPEYISGEAKLPFLKQPETASVGAGRVSNLDKYLQTVKTEQGRNTLSTIVNTIKENFNKPLSRDINPFDVSRAQRDTWTKAIIDNNLVDKKTMNNWLKWNKDRQTGRPASEYDKKVATISNKFNQLMEGAKDKNDPYVRLENMQKAYAEFEGLDKVTRGEKNAWNRFIRTHNELNPNNKVLGSESQIRFSLKKGKPNIADVFTEHYRDNYGHILKNEPGVSVNRLANIASTSPSFRYLNYIRRTAPENIKNDPKKFFAKYNPNELKNSGDFKRFKLLDDARLEVNDLIKPILLKLFPKETKVSMQIAHKFESAGIKRGYVDPDKLLQGGSPKHMYMDISTINAVQQRQKWEPMARKALENFRATKDQKYYNEFVRIHEAMKKAGVQGEAYGFQIGESRPFMTRFSELLTRAYDSGKINPDDIVIHPVTKKKVTIDDLANEVYTSMEKATEVKKPSERRVFGVTTTGSLGETIPLMKDGGIIQYFQDGTGEEGVTADQGPISGFDVKPFIPPGARIDEDPLTLGQIGEGIQTTAETAWPYMVPGVGEHLSHKDYRHFSSEAEKAWAEGDYPKYAGMLALGSVALGGTIPNWTVVGAVPNVALGIYKGAKKALTSTPKKIAQKPVVEMEKRYIIKDESGTKVYQTKSPDDADQKVLVLKDKENKNFTVEEINVAKKVEKPKKTKQELVHIPTVGADDIIGAGNNRLFYSKMDQFMQGTNGNIRVKTGASGNVADIPINEVKLSAKEWHDSFRAAGIKESELVDSYIRQYLNKKGVFTNGKFTNNQPIAYAEIKELLDGSPSKFVQASKYSDADGNLKFADSGRSAGYKNGTREEHVLWMDSKDIRGDVQSLPSNVRQYEGHKDMRKVETDVNFGVNNKLEGEPYVIGWSLVDDRPGKLANGKNVTVTTANEIQSDFLQKAASLKANLKKDLRNTLQAGNTSTAEAIKKKLDNIFRQMPLTSAEIKSYTTQIEQASKVFDDVAKMDLNMVDDAVMKQLDDAAKLRDEALVNLNKFIDDIDPKDLFPNIPFKDQKDWVSSLIKNDLAIAAKKRFYFDENGVLQVNKNAPSHYSVAPSITQKKRWSVDTNKGMNVPPNMRTSKEHGKAVAYDLEYGGPNVTDSSGRHFTSNAEETLRKISSAKNAEFSIGKVKHGNEMVDSFLIELTPEMLTPYVQYFKHGGLVEKIPQYNPLKSVLDVLGPIGAY